MRTIVALAMVVSFVGQSFAWTLPEHERRRRMEAFGAEDQTRIAEQRRAEEQARIEARRIEARRAEEARRVEVEGERVRLQEETERMFKAEGKPRTQDASLYGAQGSASDRATNFISGSGLPPHRDQVSPFGLLTPVREAARPRPQDQKTRTGAP